jgi:hypothetical protein
MSISHEFLRNISGYVNCNYSNSVGEFPLPKLLITYRIINTICRLLRAFTRSSDATNRYHTKILKGLSYLFVVTIVDTTVISNKQHTVR